MVKADDLRLGNYIISNREVLEVDYINGNNYIGFTKYPFGEPVESCVPIDLNKEWLEKFGFVNYEAIGSWTICLKDDMYEVKFENGSFWFTFATITRDDNWKQMPDRKLEYVHELQNIFYSVTRRNLKLI